MLIFSLYCKLRGHRTTEEDWNFNVECTVGCVTSLELLGFFSFVFFFFHSVSDAGEHIFTISSLEFFFVISDDITRLFIFFSAEINIKICFLFPTIITLFLLFSSACWPKYDMWMKSNIVYLYELKLVDVDCVINKSLCNVVSINLNMIDCKNCLFECQNLIKPTNLKTVFFGAIPSLSLNPERNPLSSLVSGISSS